MFNEGTDIYWARQQISERIRSIRSGIAQPILRRKLTANCQRAREIFTLCMQIKAHQKTMARHLTRGFTYSARLGYSPAAIKSKGVTEINSQGGFERQYQVAPVPEKLLAYKLTLSDVITALKLNNSNQGAGFIERFDGQYLVRSPGQLKTIDDIANTVIAKRDDAPVRIKDVANVRLGKELRTSAATYNGKETVLGTAMMLIGENSRVVAKAMADKLNDVQLSLPEGVVVEAVYDRTTLVDKTIATVKTNLLQARC
ncbi:efflux RND transporter permease subunit [Pseudoalteromonas sp. B193]